MRQVPRDGKRQATTYYCSSTCFQASYKHIGWYDGKTAERKRARDAKRDRQANNAAYYAAHREEICARHRERYWADPEAARRANQHNKRKRKLLGSEEQGVPP